MDCWWRVANRTTAEVFEFDRDIAASALSACFERGLLVNRIKPNALRFMPPLTIGNNEVDEAINILEPALSSVA